MHFQILVTLSDGVTPINHLEEAIRKGYSNMLDSSLKHSEAFVQE